MNKVALFSCIRERLETDPDCIIFTQIRNSISESWSIKRLWYHSELFSPYIQEYFEPGQVVPIYMSRSYDCLAIVLSCIATNRAFSIINSHFQVPQLEHIVKQADVKALFIDSSALNTLKKGINQVNYLHNIQFLAVPSELWSNYHDKQITKLKEKLSVLLIKEKEGMHSHDIQLPIFKNSNEINPMRPAVCLFTSGSTGAPKGVLISDSDLVNRATSEFSSFGLKEGDKILNILPWSFDVGLSQVLTALVCGTTLVALDSWLPADIIHAAKQHNVIGISAVPSIWIEILASGLNFYSPQPKYATISGGSLTAEHLSALTALLNETRIIKTYGQTETCRSTIAYPEDIKQSPNSVGQIYPGAHVYIVDKQMKCLPANTKGEIMHTGTGVMLGYLDGNNEGKLIKNPFFDQDKSPQGILTGDHGYFDDFGCLQLMGRSDDLIKIKGNRIYLSEIIAQIEVLPEIKEAQIITIENPNNEDDIILFTTLKEEAKPSVDSATLKKKLMLSLPSYMVPKDIVVIDDFPRTSSRKIDRVALQKQIETD